MKSISFKFAINVMLGILCFLIVFHLLILTQIFPYNIVWGGNIQNPEQMKKFEISSIFINALIIFVVSIKRELIKINIPNNIINLFLWLFILFFAFNTFANLFAETITETFIFTPLAFISTLFLLRIVLEKKKFL